MPGRDSLIKAEYYAYRQNQFWKIIFALFESIPDSSYQNRISFILNNKIAIWDVLSQCSRKLGTDNTIVEGVTNDINEFIGHYPKIKCAFFNGNKAHDLFKDLVFMESKNRSRLMFETLPSSSSANARMKFEEKVSKWKAIRAFLGD
jgi:hypoxanthine-DNA glycosylase